MVGGSKPSIMTEETFRLIVVLLIQVIFRGHWHDANRPDG